MLTGAEAKVIEESRAGVRFKLLRGGQHDAARAVRLPARTDTQKDLRLYRPFERHGGSTVTKTFSSPSESAYLQQLFLNLGGNENLTRPFVESPWVYACVMAWVRAEQKTSRIYRSGPSSDDDELELTDPKVAAIEALLQRPNPSLLGLELRTLTTMYDALAGESFWFLLNNDNEGNLQPVAGVNGATGPAAQIEMPSEVWVIAGNLVDMELDDDSMMPTHWSFHTRKGRVRFPAHAVLQLKQVDPYNPYRGMGPMQAAMRAAAQDFQAERFDEALLNNGGMPGGIFTVKQGTMNRKQRNTLRKNYKENHASPLRDRMPLILGADVDFKPLAHSPRDMELQEKRAANKRTILAAYGTPSLLVSHTEDVQNRAVADAAERVFWMNTIGPMLERRDAQINHGLLRRIPALDGVWIDTDLSSIDVLKPDLDALVKQTLDLMDRGQRSWDEAVRITGLPVPEPVAGGGERFIETNKVPVDMARENARAAPSSPDSARLIEIRATDAAALAGVAERNGHVVEAAVASLRGPADEAGDPAPELSDAEKAWVEGMTDEVRAAYFVEFDKQLAPHDKRVAGASKTTLAKWLRDAKRRVHAKAGKKDADLLMGADTFEEGVEAVTKQSTAQIERQLDALLKQGLDRWQREYAGLIKTPFNSTWDTASSRMADELGADAFLDHATPEALRFLRGKRIDVAEGVLSRFANEVRETVMRVMVSENVTTGTLAARLQQVLKKADAEINRLAGGIPARADRIARTENTAIAGRARSSEMKKEGVRKHMWVSTTDAATRDDHSTLDGRVREVGKSFGFNLRWPGDTNAKAEQVVNCRCTTAPAPR